MKNIILNNGVGMPVPGLGVYKMREPGECEQAGSEYWKKQFFLPSGPGVGPESKRKPYSLVGCYTPAMDYIRVY